MQGLGKTCKESVKQVLCSGAYGAGYRCVYQTVLNLITIRFCMQKAQWLEVYCITQSETWGRGGVGAVVAFWEPGRWLPGITPSQQSLLLAHGLQQVAGAKDPRKMC
jgi:hypothetical protein